jgi:hypothetical protein
VRDVDLDDPGAVERELGRLGEVTADGEAVVLRAGSARFAVTRAGRVEAGMPLHAFAAEEVTRLRVDPDAGRVVVTGEGVEYEFRVP